MKVIYVCAKSFYFTEGYRGRVIHAKGIVEGLLENDCEVEIVSGPGITDIIDEHDRLTCTTIGNKQDNFYREILWRKKLLKYFKNNVKRFDLLILRYGFSNPILSWKISKICEVDKCYSIIEVNSLGTEKPLIFSFFDRFIRFIELYIISRYNKVYVVSGEEKRRIKKEKKNIDIITIPNATTNTEIAYEKTTNDVRFVYLGVLHDYYNFEEIVKAFENINSNGKITLALIIYGYGKNDKFLKESSNKNANIKLMGEYDNDEIPELVNRESDILLLPYKKNTIAEIGSPMKLFEYMVLGAPILASNIGQITDVIRHKENGYIYESDDYSDLTSKMNYLIKNKRARKKAGLMAHKEAIKKHTWENRMKTLLSSIDN